MDDARLLISHRYGYDNPQIEAPPSCLSSSSLQRQVDDGALAGLAGLRALPGEAGRVLRQRAAQQPLAGAERQAGDSQSQVLLVASAGKQGGTFTAISVVLGIFFASL